MGAGVLDGAMTDLLLRARRIITAEGERSGAVRVSAGRIVSVDSFDAPAGSGPDPDPGSCWARSPVFLDGRARPP